MTCAAAVRRNVFANFMGYGWSALLTIAIVPLYLRLLGTELYGILGFYATLQMLSIVVERGFATAVNREVATMMSTGRGTERMRSLVRSLEVIYWGGAALIGAIAWLTSDVVASRWLNPIAASPDLVASGLAAMGLTLALQFPFALYSGVMLGMQRHVSYNCLTGVATTLRLLLPAMVVYATGPNLAVFFGIQASVALAQTLTGRAMTFAALPAADATSFDFNRVRAMRNYAVEVTLLTGVTVAVLQADRLVISHLATLERFAQYSIAAAAASGLGVISLPIYTAVFPRFTELFSQGDLNGVRALYHQATQLMAALIMPTAALIVAFAGPLLQVWTGDSAVAAAAATPLALLTAAVCASSLTFVAQALQLANGWTSFAIRLNAVGVVLLVSAAWVAASYLGSSAVATVVFVWHTVAAIMTALAVDRVVLSGSARRWLVVDVLPPLLAAAAVAAAGRAAYSHVRAEWAGTLIAATALVAATASAASVPVTRTWWRARNLARSGAR